MTHEEEIVKLTTAMKETESTCMYERYLAVRLHLEGRTLTGRSFPQSAGIGTLNESKGFKASWG